MAFFSPPFGRLLPTFAAENNKLLMTIINLKMVLVACMLPSTAAYAQYPQITDEAQHYADSLGRISKAHRDSAWAVALPVVIEEAKQGRPYVPWASRPYDLRQAKIPAFPGAELYCGEYGVIDVVPAEDAVKWYRTINSVFEKYGIGRAAWSYKKMDFGLTDSRLDGVRDELLKLM